jgi:hypothetical protein
MLSTQETLPCSNPPFPASLERSSRACPYRDLSQSQVRKLKIYFLDWLGSAIAGKGEKPVQIILDVIRDLGGTPESTIIASQSYGNCLLAALANGASSHVVEMDDLHRESILHPAAAIILCLRVGGDAGRRSIGVFDEQCHEQAVAPGKGGSQRAAFSPFGPEGVHGRAQDSGRRKRIFQSHVQRF